MTTEHERKIFVSYRRSDHPDFVQRIRDYFVTNYGRDNVFMDFDSIGYFSDFAAVIQDKVQEADVVIAIIGPRWMELMLEKATRFNEQDYVRIELELALKLDKIIAPIRIKGAPAPQTDDLPEALKPMLKYNFAEVNSDRTYYETMDAIMASVEAEISKRESDIASRDIYSSIESFYEAFSAGMWQSALEWVEHIASFNKIPMVFNIHELKNEVEQKIREENATLEMRQNAEKEYEVIRRMSNNASINQERLWKTLQVFWQNYPAYDPDNLAQKFRQPLPDHLSLEFIHKPLDNWKQGNGQWQEVNWNAQALNIRFGLYDDVHTIQQLPLTFDLLTGNVFVCGTTGSGKSTALKSIITSITTQYSPSDVHLYLIDYNVQLISFESFPHVGAYIPVEAAELVERLLNLLFEEVDKRRAALRSTRQENIQLYNQNANEKLPHLIVIIDDWDEFYDIIRHSELNIMSLIRSSRLLGIHFIVSSTRSMQVEAFVTKLALQQLSRADYRQLLGTSLPEEGDIFTSGRGYARLKNDLVQFQTAYPIDVSDEEKETGVGITEKLTSLAEVMQDALDSGYRLPHRLKNLPSWLPLTEVNEQAGTSSHGIPLGLYDKDLSVFSIPFDADHPHVIISGSSTTGKTETIRTIALQLMRQQKQNVALAFIDLLGKFWIYDNQLSLAELPSVKKVVAHYDDFSDYVNWLEEAIASGQEVYTFIDNYEELSSHYDYNNAVPQRIAQLMRSSSNSAIHFVIAVNFTSGMHREPLWNLLADSQYGIALDTNKLESIPFATRVPTKYRNVLLPKGRAFEVAKSIVAPIQIAVEENPEDVPQIVEQKPEDMQEETQEETEEEKLLKALEQTIAKIHTQHEKLMSGGWIGMEASQFYSLMEQENLPGLARVMQAHEELKRLMDELETAKTATLED